MLLGGRTLFSPKGLAPNRLLQENFAQAQSSVGTRTSPVLLLPSQYRSTSVDWVICAPAAYLGCGGHFSCPLSGIEP